MKNSQQGQRLLLPGGGNVTHQSPFSLQDIFDHRDVIDRAKTRGDARILAYTGLRWSPQDENLNKATPISIAVMPMPCKNGMWTVLQLTVQMKTQCVFLLLVKKRFKNPSSLPDGNNLCICVVYFKRDG